jgi:myo-inositol 2-dehydrogenase / D-chiro-inositol 1-dehydrogenase
MPPNQTFSLFEDELLVDVARVAVVDRPVRVALLGCGMMGQEHCSYMAGYSDQLRIDFMCDPHEPSLTKCLKVLRDFSDTANNNPAADMMNTSLTTTPTLLDDEALLLERVHEIDLLVVCSPNHLHTDTLLRWGRFEHLTILVEKPVAVSLEQHARLTRAMPTFRARIWVAMEYRFIPAIAKLLDLIPETVGDIKMVTIRENRYPFLHKIGAWNRNRMQTGDSLVEKWYVKQNLLSVQHHRPTCINSQLMGAVFVSSCHFFDLMRLITGEEANLDHVRALAQRGINYGDEPSLYDVPIIDSAYVTLPFQSNDKVKTIANLELCMYAEGSRHQEEIIVTGTKGRLEAYLPENKVYAFTRPSPELWSNRAEPPPPSSIKQRVYDCSDVRHVHGLEDSAAATIPTHGGYHYSSTAIEWYKLLQAMKNEKETGVWTPLVSLQDGLRAVEIGLRATQAIVNVQDM